MDDFWERVAKRHGLLTTGEGTAAFKKSGFYRRVKAGQFVVLHRGVWRVAGSPETDRQQLLGLALALDSVATARSTLALHDVPGFTLTYPVLLRVGSSHPSRNLGELAEHVTLRRTNFLPDHHVTVVDGIPSTTLARALCDASATLGVVALSKTVDNCKRLELISYEQLAECREDVRARGRRRTTYLDQILQDRIAGWVVGESPPEDVVRKWLQEEGYEPVAQHWIVANGRRRRLDVALPADRIAIEYQGIAAHSTATAVVDDSEKITDLQLAMWFVVLVTKKTTKYEFLRNVAEGVRIQRGRLLS
jgi:hypothetical protein